LTVVDGAGNQRKAKSRWGAIYGAVGVFTIVMIGALIAFSAWFSA
jgi:hypothetical protein